MDISIHKKENTECWFINIFKFKKKLNVVFMKL